MSSVPDGETCETVQEMERSWKVWKAIQESPQQYFSRQNRENWVRRLGDHGAVMLTFFWASALANSVFTNADDRRVHHLYANRWPLPVGKKALADHATEIQLNGTAGYFGDPSFLWDLMPFDGDELAAVIIDAYVNGCRIEAFGLVTLEPITDFEETAWKSENAGAISIDGDEPIRHDLLENPKVYRIGGLKYRISGANPMSSEVMNFSREVGNWWRMLAGEKLSPGRRRKSVPYSMAQAAYWDVRSALEEAEEHRKPSYQEVCDNLDAKGLCIGVTRFGEIVREWTADGLAWPPPIPE